MPRLTRSKEPCFECGARAVHAHHVVPQSLGGTKTVNLCAKCHGKVHDRKIMSSSHLVKSAIAKRRAAGLWHGVAPYGYNLMDGKLVKNIAEFAILEIILKLHNQGLTSGQISKHLTRRKLEKRNGTDWDRRSVWQTVTRYRQRERERLESDQ